MNRLRSDWRADKGDPYFRQFAEAQGLPIACPPPAVIPGEEWAMRPHLRFETR